MRQILCTVVSEECWGVLVDPTFEPKNDTTYELWSNIFDCLPNLSREDLKLYWRYSNEIFLPVKEFFTYQTFQNLSLKAELILLVTDAQNDLHDTRKLLKSLDAEEEYREMVKKRNKYDVAHLVGQEAICQESGEENNAQDNKEGRKVGREAVVREILTYALKKRQIESVPEEKFFTADCALKSALIECVKKDIARLKNTLKQPKDEIIERKLTAQKKGGKKTKKGPKKMKEEAIIQTRSARNKTVNELVVAESTDLVNLFASPAGREMFKYKPRPKHKHKLNPALDFFIQNKPRNASIVEETNSTANNNTSCQEDSKFASVASSSSTTVENCRSRRNSIDLYEEAASILGLTCSQTDDCKCLECQCHYFDFEEEIDFPTGSDYVVDHSSSCTIQ